MNRVRIGEFLRELRRQKGLTQEQFAEIFNVSNRTVSRWETGNNLPDIDILIDIADYYELELSELFSGERKSESMNKETEAAALKAAEYTNMQAERYTSRVRRIFLVSAVLWSVSRIIAHTELNEVEALRGITSFVEGATIGLLLCGVLAASSYGHRLKAFKKRLLKKDK